MPRKYSYQVTVVALTGCSLACDRAEIKSCLYSHEEDAQVRLEDLQELYKGRVALASISRVPGIPDIARCPCGAIRAIKTVIRGSRCAGCGKMVGRIYKKERKR